MIPHLHREIITDSHYIEIFDFICHLISGGDLKRSIGGVEQGHWAIEGEFDALHLGQIQPVGSDGGC
jgi:hypothetical protein